MPAPLETRAAAQRRAGATARAGDRPSRRRDQEDGPARPCVTSRLVRADLRADDDGSWTFDGMASVTGVGYDMWDWAGPYTEVVMPGAFAVTLARTDLDVPLVVQHDPIRRMARTTNGTLDLLEVVDDEVTGLVTTARLDPADPDVAYVVPKIRSGLVDEMSFRFFIVAGQWSPDWTEYHITEVDLHRGDVSVVGYGANPATSAGLRTAPRTGRDLVAPADLAPYGAR